MKRSLITAMTGAILSVSVPAVGTALELVALTTTGELLIFDVANPALVIRRPVEGIRASAIGIDYRPADGLLYLVDRDGEIYVISDRSTTAEYVASLTLAFPGDQPCGFDFTPQADRLRLVGAGGDNVRLNVKLGAGARDRGVSYVASDRNAGARPQITGVGYTNNRASADKTVMYDIDSRHDVLAIQDPPNDGLLQTVGDLGVDVGDHVGFEIISSDPDRERAILVSDGNVYEVDLSTGGAKALGTLDSGKDEVVGLTIWPWRGAAAR